MLLIYLNNVDDGYCILLSAVLNYIMWKIHVTWLWIPSQDFRVRDMPALVGKKADDSALASHSLFDCKEIFDWLVKLSCLTSCKKLKQQKSKKRCRVTDTNQQYRYHHCHHDTDTNQHYFYHHCHHDVTADQCYLNLPEDMVEDNPLDIENIKEKQDDDNEIQQSSTRHHEWYSHKTFNNARWQSIQLENSASQRIK